MSNIVSIFTDPQKFSIFNECLEYLFKNQYTRYSNVKNEKNLDPEIFQLACQIYKRGIQTHIQKSTLYKTTNEYKKPNIKVINEKEFLLKKESFSSDYFFIIVDNFFSLSDKNENVFYIDATEKNKNLTLVAKIMSHIHNVCIVSKIQHIIAFGGGITLDVAGFVASLLQTKLSLIPTTLLSMIDATIGGKTGINYEPYGKNQVGSFYFCDEIIIAPHFLNTLPHDEIISGLCEALKHAWIAGNFIENIKIFSDLLDFKNTGKLIDADFIINNLKIKHAIVQMDPYETTNVRSVLNFGHTIGHALETLMIQKNQKIPHGIAVAYGMLFALKNYYPEEKIGKNEFIRFLELIVRYYPIRLNSFPYESWNKILKQDKKNKSQLNISVSLPCYGFLINPNNQHVISSVSINKLINQIHFK